MIKWAKEHWWLAGAIPTCLAALIWVLAGGTAPFVRGVGALGQENVSDAIAALPETVEKIDRNADGIAANARRLEEVAAADRIIIEKMDDILDDVRSLKNAGTEIVDWAEAQTLELNEGRVCHLGESCTVWLRGRRTPQGADCRFLDAGIYLVVPGSEEGRPVRRAPGWQPANLQLAYKTFPVDFSVPTDITPGRWHFVSIAVYADCPFAREGEVVERPSVRVPVLIEAAERD